MAYNLTFMDTGNNILDFTQGINEAAGGYIATFLLYLVWVMFIIVFRNSGIAEGMIASSMITTLLAVLFWSIGWISFGFIFPPAILLFAGLIYKALSR